MVALLTPELTSDVQARTLLRTGFHINIMWSIVGHGSKNPTCVGFADKSAVDLCPGAVLIVDSLVTNSRRGSILHPFILNMVPRADYPVVTLKLFPL